MKVTLFNRQRYQKTEYAVLFWWKSASRINFNILVITKSVEVWEIL